MRARVYSNGGNSTGGFTFNGGQMTGALILAGNPSDPLEAVAKQYVDSSLVNLNASHLSSGTLPAARLPAFGGDIVKPAGTSAINLAPNGVTAGDYVKPTVDAKGCVTGGGALVATDIPNLPWDKIITGKPTTLSGYGINDAVSLAGGTVSGFLTFSGSVTNPLQAVTKQYVDVTLSSSSGISIGDIIRKPYATTPAGFLKCNGALVDKTTYNALYSVINDRFGKQKQFTSAQPWAQQYNINNLQSGDISNWNNGPLAGSATSGMRRVAVTKNRVYMFGGWNTSVFSSVYYAPINADGSLGSWTAGTSLPTSILGCSVLTIKNKLYIIGGYIGADASGTDMSNIIYSANINSDGSIGTWTNIGAIPGPHYVGQTVVTSTKLYLIGGALTNLAGSQSNKIYSCNINSDGTLGSWTTEANAPFYKMSAALILTKNRVYICGGESSLYSNSYTSTVYTAPINSDGTLGTWVSSTSMPIPLSVGDSYVTKNKAYILGGANLAGVKQSVLTVGINSDGTLGTWGFGTDLPSLRSGACVFATKNKLYIMGGVNGSIVVNTSFVADISGGLNDYSDYYSLDTTNYVMSGSGQPWQQQYQSNTLQSADISGWVATSTMPGPMSYGAVFTTKNRVYMCGGWSANNTNTATVYTAPINTDGTLGAWTTGTSLPAAMSAIKAVIAKNRVYIFGGWQGSVPASSAVYHAVINSDGTIGTWTANTAMPSGRGWYNPVLIRDRIYLIGGSNGTAADAIFYSAAINSDGTLAAWTTETSLPINVHSPVVIVTKNRIYLIGGLNAGGSTMFNYYTATITSSGGIGTWTNLGNFIIQVSHAQVFVTANRAYLIGGTNGASNLTTIYSAAINDDGTLGTWAAGSSLNGWGGYYHSVFATNGRVYVAGGVLNSAFSNAVYFASILGGTNDYSPYYDGTYTPAVIVDPSTTFALPDLSTSEKFDTISYIKY